MELRADDIVARNHRRDRAAIVGGRRRCRPGRSGRAGRNGRNRRAALRRRPRYRRAADEPASPARCSSPCGGSSAPAARGSGATSPAIQSSPGTTSYSRPRVAMSCMPTQMPRNGRPRRAHALFERFDHARHGVEAAPAIGEGADAGQHDVLGGGTTSGSRVTRHLAGEPRFARGALEGLVGGVQIARPVIDDRDAHFSRPPPGTGRALEAARLRRRASGRATRALSARRRRRAEASSKKGAFGAVAVAGADDVGERSAASRQRRALQRAAFEARNRTR